MSESNKAVSEVIGYIIVMGIVLTAIGLIYAEGPGMVQDAQEHEHLNNVHQTFVILQNNLDQIVQREVPSRGTELRMVDAELHTQDVALLNTTTTGGQCDDIELDSPEPVYVESDSVTYEFGDNRMVYENGAVIRGQPGRPHVMMEEPAWRFDSDNEPQVIRTVETSGSAVLSGDGTILVRGDSDSRDFDVIDGGCVRISVASRAGHAWEGYFEKHSPHDIEFDEDPDAHPDDRATMVTAWFRVSDEGLITTEDEIEMEIN